jgi:hypothetical protein
MKMMIKRILKMNQILMQALKNKNHLGTGVISPVTLGIPKELDTDL